MQQEASRKLGFTLKKTMSVAQTLYEGVKIADRGTVGLITYMRTDSTRISEEARAAQKHTLYQHMVKNSMKIGITKQVKMPKTLTKV